MLWLTFVAHFVCLKADLVVVRLLFCCCADHTNMFQSKEGLDALFPIPTDTAAY